VIGLHFGDDSEVKFAADARARKVEFLVLAGASLAVDLDEPSDLAALDPR
jgi:2-phospho-L-lactate guanylyltransferase (CobY/MobA/RfbA family)